MKCQYCGSEIYHRKCNNCGAENDVSFGFGGEIQPRPPRPEGPQNRLDTEGIGDGLGIIGTFIIGVLIVVAMIFAVTLGK